MPYLLFMANHIIYLDSDASMRTHVSKTVSNCFAALRQIRSIRQCVSRQVMLSMVVSLVLQDLTLAMRHSSVSQPTS